ncbi:MAG: tRNA (N(6)-L-threonylcarbamoyladenosine(37)-C(2))-methylthiotransferase MtaB [Bacteroidales bacterium]|nr:tRNA (N(6)-L-threonylcarbamoyladenosine(37)-C(2))-methylthiotransferase MtaB [Bacteroidales bacterium]
MVKKVAFKTLGCRLNQFETDALATDFYNAGYKIVPFTEKADAYIINTCTVTNTSDHKSKYTISQAIRRNAGSVVVVTGCMVNNQKELLEQRGDITYVVENNRKSSLFSLVDAHFKGEILHPSDLKQSLFDFTVAEKGFHTRSMIKIQDGCNNFCTYCIVPMVRGRASSRPVEDVLQNIRQVVSFGYKEVVLTGVNISRYEYQDTGFEDLIEKILELEGDFRVRISSIEPEGFGDKFIKLFAHPKMCPHLHLCLQSGSDRVLMQMRRQYNLHQYLNLIEGFRSNYPDFNFTTDIIVGFPGETDEDFNQTCKVVKEVGFSHVHTFKYSVRKGTRAERMPGHLPEKIKHERSQIIRDIAEENKLHYRQSLVGKQQTVLIEKVQKGFARGYGEHYVPVKISGEMPKNTFNTVTIKGLSDESDPQLIGQKTSKSAS